MDNRQSLISKWISTSGNNSNCNNSTTRWQQKHFFPCLKQSFLKNLETFNWIPAFCLLSQSMKHSVVPGRSEIKYSEVVLLGESELQTCDQDQDISYQNVCDLQTYSLVPVSTSQTPLTTRPMFIRSPTGARMTCSMDLSSSSYFYSNVLPAQTIKTVSTPILSTTYCQAVSSYDSKMQLGGEKEPSEERSESSLCPTDEFKTFSLFLKPYQTTISFSDYNSTPQSASLLPHSVEFPPLKHPFPQSNSNPVPSLQPDTFTHPNASSDKFSTSFSPFFFSLMDFSYCPVECEPYISIAV